MLNWNDLTIFHQDMTTEMVGAERVAALREFKEHGTMAGAWFARQPGQEHLADAEDWGPESPDAVDWSGFDVPDAPVARPFKIQFSGPIKAKTFETYGQAVAFCRAKWPGAAIGHDGDLTERSGDRTCVWETEADAVNDGGGKAVAAIVRVEESDGDADL